MRIDGHSKYLQAVFHHATNKQLVKVFGQAAALIHRGIWESGQRLLSDTESVLSNLTTEMKRKAEIAKNSSR